MKPETRIIIKSAGEMASGIAVRLHRAGFRNIVLLERENPLAVRRTVSFCEAVHDGCQTVEGVQAQRAQTPEEIFALWKDNLLPVAVDPEWTLIAALQPTMTIDAVLAKRNLGTTITEAPIVVALGPGFTAGQDAHFCIETNRGHALGRILSHGQTQPNTGIPGNIEGYTIERVLRAPCDGTVRIHHDIGTKVTAGDTVMTIDTIPVHAAISGIVRGCIRPGSFVRKGVKVGDIDPRGNPEHCRTISEKARALGGSVLEILCAGYFAAVPDRRQRTQPRS